MNPQALASLSNLALYGAMGVLALAMLAFAAYIARGSGARVRGAQAAPERELVGASGLSESEGAATGRTGASALRPDASPDDVPGGASLDDVPSGASPERAVGRRSGALGTTLSWLGTMLLACSIALRGASVQRPPVSNMFEFAVAGSFLVLALYLGLGLRRPLRWLGLFVVTPVLLVLGLAITTWYTEASELVPSLKSTWLVIHVPIAILSTAVFTIAFVVLLLHLAQARREAKVAAGGPAGPRWLAALPDSQSLDRTAYSFHVVAFPLWTFTLIAGAIWGQQAWGTYWSWDPKEVWTFVIWTIYAAYLHARATSGWSLRTANVIAVVGYLAIIVNFTIVNYYFPGMHSYSGVKI